MDVKVFSTLFLVLIINCHKVSSRQYGIVRKDTHREATFRLVRRNRVLDITPIKEYNQSLSKECSRWCLRNPSCQSFNYNNNLEKCELLVEDRNTKATDQKFVDRSGWNYYDTGVDFMHSSWRNRPLVS